MTFKKKHKFGFVSENDEPLESSPLCIKLKKGVKNRVRSIPDWQDKLRSMIEQWVKDELDQGE